MLLLLISTECATKFSYKAEDLDLTSGAIMSLDQLIQ